MNAWEDVQQRAKRFQSFIRDERDPQDNTAVVNGFDEHMRAKYGRPCCNIAEDEPDGGKRLDWCQALARVQFGVEFHAALRREENYAPNAEALRIAREWVEGAWPECIAPVATAEVA